MLAHWARLSRRQYEYSIFLKLIFFLQNARYAFAAYAGALAAFEP
jgi:hypothetical protein